MTFTSGTQSPLLMAVVATLAMLSGIAPEAAEPRASDEAGRTCNTKLHVLPAPGEVKIDGNLEDWDQSGQIFMCSDLAEQKHRRSAYAMGMYDEECLYLAFEVLDPTPLRNTVNPAERPGQGWRGDCLQLRLRLPGELLVPRAVWLDSWYCRPEKTSALILTDVADMDRADIRERGGKVAFREREEGDGYVQELKIPWGVLKLKDRIRAGFTFGMGVELVGGQNGDADEAFRLVDLVAWQGVPREAFFNWPNRWGEAKLMPEGNLESAGHRSASAEKDPSANVSTEKQQEHPFLICTRDQFPQIRKRSQREPWASMKENALKRVAKRAEVTEARNAGQLQRYAGACALAYILVPERRSHYADRVYESIVKDLGQLTFDEAEKHRGVVPPMGAAFVSIIALDIVHDDLTDQQIEECESTIKAQINKIEKDGAWFNGRRGTHGTWEIYKGERRSPDDKFYNHYMKQMTSDGVTTTATGYAWYRLASSDSRPQKTGYADVLEFTGIDERYYDNPRLSNFYRWLFGYSATASKQLHAFGDFIPTDVVNGALAYRAGRFDREAGRYMAWALKGRKKPGHVLAYVLKKTAFEPKVPTSRLFPDGGAFLCEPKDNPASLGAALYNIAPKAMWHAHQETNAVSLTAYGSRLLMNGGWLGESQRPAPLNNTVTVNGKEHDTRSGGGLEEGLTGKIFDYAAGNSGAALPDDASHTRSLLLVHGAENANGYFIIMDEVEADAGETVNQYLHPATDIQPETVQPEKEYNARANLFNKVTSNHLAFFYVTKPERVNITTSPSGSPRAGREKHYRLDAAFPVDETGDTRIATVVFPHNDQHKKAEFERIGGEDGPGVRINQPQDLHDYFHIGDVNQDDVRFEGKASFYRMRGETIEFYFVRDGTTFRNRDAAGFTADNPVSILMRGRNGRITTKETTEVTFYHPGLSRILVDGKALETKDTGGDWLKVEVPPGNNQQVHLKIEDQGS